MSATPRELIRALNMARRRARLAQWYGDMAGCIIAEGDARRIRRELAAVR